MVNESSSIYCQIEESEWKGGAYCAECKSKYKCSQERTVLTFDYPPIHSIVLITESPFYYGIPFSDPDYERKKIACPMNPQEFLDFFYGNFGIARFNKESNEFEIPMDIFEFIYNTFRPAFRSANEVTRERYRIDFNRIYWTHMVKKSLKGKNDEQRSELAKKCSRIFLKEELKTLKPQLIVVASKYAVGELLGISSLKEVMDIMKETPRGDHVKSRLCSFQYVKNRNGFWQEFDIDTNWIQNCMVAVFPNPSPANGWKKFYYKGERGKNKDLEVARLIEWQIKTIHRLLTRDEAMIEG